MVKAKFFIFIFFFLFLLDQFIKLLVVRHQISSSSCPGVSFILNKGIGFGLFSSQLTNTIMIFVYITILLIILFWFSFKEDKKSAEDIFPPMLMFFGILSNLIDRIIYGGVVDYIDICIIPVFNIGDAMITISCISFLFFILNPIKK